MATTKSPTSRSEGLSYTVMALLRGRWRDVHPLMYAVSAVFVWYFAGGYLV